MEKESRERTMARLEELPELKRGEEEFIEAIIKCPACSVKLALELGGSEDPNDKALLKKILAGLGEKLLKIENKKHSKPILRTHLKIPYLRCMIIDAIVTRALYVDASLSYLIIILLNDLTIRRIYRQQLSHAL